MSFGDQTEQWDYTVDSSPDSTFGTSDMSDASLENFFSRPIKIQSYEWAIGATLYQNFNPWRDFFENPRVANRINNYNLLRCKLKVRMVVNGNSFYYGRAIASYLPLHTLDGISRDRPWVFADIIGASQRPKILLDPTTNQGGTLTLPYVYPKNALSIPDAEYRRMGEVTIHGMSPLRHANAATDSITVSIFAWAEDVSLSVLTSRPVTGLTPQSGDEYMSGPISKPASVLAKIAGKLTSMPVIEPYARATEMAASAVASIAQVFGMSRPASLCDIQPYKPTILGNMANTNVPDSCQRLTLDAKQETTIDPRVMGLSSTDEMTVASVAQRESFIAKFPWGVATAPETLLWNTRVSPVLWAVHNDEFHLPACAFATLPFTNWRGTMKFRFQIVASAYHKGRIKIVYDPNVQVDPTAEYNTNYTYIVDLAKQRDFTVDVGWGQEFSMMEHDNPASSAGAPFSTTHFTQDYLSLANGVLSVYVVNDLTVPNNADNDIEVLVYVSAGDDFEVFNPTEQYIEDYTLFEPQSGFVPQSGENDHPDTDDTVREDEPIKTDTSIQMVKKLDDSDMTNLVYFGDPIVSFRQMLKRYNYHASHCPTAISNNRSGYFEVVNNNIPYYRGYAPDAVNLTSVPVASTPYNYSKTTLMNYIIPAYTCVRGSTRWKYIACDFFSRQTGTITATRLARHTDGYQRQTSLLNNVNNGNAREKLVLKSHGLAGMTANSMAQNPAVEIEVPFYENVRFFPAKRVNLTAASLDRQMAFHKVAMTFTGNTNGADSLDSYVATGEDFTLAFFTGCPPLYYLPTEPAE